MRRVILMGVIGLGLLLAGCGQQAATVPTTPPTSAPAATTPPTQEPTNAPTSVPTPSIAPTSAATTTPSSAPATAAPTDSAPTTAPTTSAPSGRVTDTPLAAPSTAPVQSEIVTLATRSLAALPAVGARSLTTKSVEEVDWSDSSLGCPDPAALYLAVITPGYKIILSDGSTEFPVHTNSDGSVMVWCKDGKPTPIPPVRS